MLKIFLQKFLHTEMCLIREMQYFHGIELGQTPRVKIAKVQFLVIVMSIFASDIVFTLQILEIPSFCANFKNYVYVTGQI